jgi:predicted Zn-dependent peptidase
VYHAECALTSYSDTGVLAIYYGTESDQVAKSLRIVKQEMKKLREFPLGTLQLHRLKEQIVGNLAMAEENYSGLMLMIGKSLLDKDRVESFPELVTKLRNVSSAEIQDMAVEFLDEEKHSSLIFKAS